MQLNIFRKITILLWFLSHLLKGSLLGNKRVCKESMLIQETLEDLGNCKVPNLFPSHSWISFFKTIFGILLLKFETEILLSQFHNYIRKVYPVIIFLSSVRSGVLLLRSELTADQRILESNNNRLALTSSSFSQGTITFLILTSASKCDVIVSLRRMSEFSVKTDESLSILRSSRLRIPAKANVRFLLSERG